MARGNKLEQRRGSFSDRSKPKWFLVMVQGDTRVFAVKSLTTKEAITKVKKTFRLSKNMHLAVKPSTKEKVDKLHLDQKFILV